MRGPACGPGQGSAPRLDADDVGAVLVLAAALVLGCLILAWYFAQAPSPAGFGAG